MPKPKSLPDSRFDPVVKPDDDAISETANFCSYGRLEPMNVEAEDRMTCGLDCHISRQLARTKGRVTQLLGVAIAARAVPATSTPVAGTRAALFEESC